jgi:hypothetical protein
LFFSPRSAQKILKECGEKNGNLKGEKQRMSLTVNPATGKVLKYLEGLPPWSRELCTELRRIILAADPLLTEEWKWGPAYSRNGLVCGWAAFRTHVKFTFFNGAAMADKTGLFNHCTTGDFNRSIKFTSLTEVKAPQLTRYIRESVAINKAGFKRAVKPEAIKAPADLLAALGLHQKALAFFKGLTPGYRNDYINQVLSAKQEKTRLARIDKIGEACKLDLKPNERQQGG